MRRTIILRQSTIGQVFTDEIVTYNKTNRVPPKLSLQFTIAYTNGGLFKPSQKYNLQEKTRGEGVG